MLCATHDAPNMRLSKLILTIILTLTSLLGRSQTLKIGDNLYAELKKWKSVKEIDSPAMSPWKEENQLLLLWTNESVLANDFYFISTADKRLVGAFFKQADSSYYLLDIDNDSILDTRTTTFYLPYQLIKSKSRISSRDTTVLKMFNHFFAVTLQSENNLNLDTAIVNYLKRFFNDTTLVNRHLVYLFATYQTLITNATEHHQSIPTELCIPIMKSLADECLAIFKQIPPLVRIYTVESLLNDKSLIDQARQAVKLSLIVYPDCIPLQVYDYNLEQDDNLKKQKLIALKKNHPNHWMVQPL
jgi:hypothetical protein